MKEKLTLYDAQEKVDKWIRYHGVRYFDELTNMAILTEEIGEIARIIAREYGMQSYKKGVTPKNLSEEIGDVLWVLCCLANQTGVDLTEAFRRSLQKKSSRDATRHKENRKLQ